MNIRYPTMASERGGQMALPSVPKFSASIKVFPFSIEHHTVLSGIGVEKQGLVIEETCSSYCIFFFRSHTLYTVFPMNKPPKTSAPNCSTLFAKMA